MHVTACLLTAGILTGGAGSELRAAPQQPDYTFPTIIVTATRTPTPADEIGSSVSIIDGADLRAQGVTTLLESLTFLPGLAVARAGEAAGTGGVYLRGGKPEHLLVLVDGIAVNDPISPGGSFDWSTISADAIERIEIVRGPQSTLYGSDAIAGVVNIITRVPAAEFSPWLDIESGSYRTVNVTAGFSGSVSGTGVNVDISRRQLGGISTAAEGDGDDEIDAWSMWSGALRIDRELSAGRLSATVRGSRSDFDIDDWGGPGGDDPNATSWKKDLTGAITLRGQLKDGWEHQVLIGGSRVHRGLLDRQNPGSDDDVKAAGDYLGVTQSAEWHHTLTTGGQRIAAGITLERQRGRSRYESVSSWGTYTNNVPEASQSSAALYVQDQFMVAGVALTIGGRIDSYTDYGVQPTGRLAASTGVGSARLRFSVGTGFRAPSMYQRFSPDYGNSELEAEASTGWDAGLEVPLMKRGSVKITRYEQEIGNLIDFVTDEVTWVSSYRNRGSVRLAGWEGEARLALTGSAGLDASATIMEAVDERTGEDLVRRPDMSLSAGVMYRPASDLSASLRFRRIGTRKDRDLSTPPYPIIDLDPVLLLDGEVSWQLNDALMLRLRMRNLTDASPVWVWGYGSMGRAIYLGIVLRR